MSLSSGGWNLRAAGYQHGAPNAEVAEGDGAIAESMVCPRCGRLMQYDAWAKAGSYIALAVCRCGYEVEF